MSVTREASRDAETLDLGDLGLDRGGQVLLKLALRRVPVGAAVSVLGRDPNLAMHLGAFCRSEGHLLRRGGAEGRTAEVPSSAPAEVSLSPSVESVCDGSLRDRGATVVRGDAEVGRWRGAMRAGAADPTRPGAVVDHPPSSWGLAARGAAVEAGSPPFAFRQLDKNVVWSDDAPRLYQQAVAAQWDPAVAIPWDEPFELDDAIEDAVVQVMTYLVENETLALIVPARAVATIHPHFREVLQLLAIQAADEARHIEVFTRRGLLRRAELGLSTAGGQHSLKSVLDEPDFAVGSFLLSVLGEGSFLSLLWFLHEHAPDPVTREIAKLAAQDEARHVAFGVAHLERHLAHDPSVRGRLARAVEQRHLGLQHTSGLNEEVFDALLLLAAGRLDPAAIARGHAAVISLQADMDEGRQKRLRRLGFDALEARTLSSLHTRNFM